MPRRSVEAPPRIPLHHNIRFQLLAEDQNSNTHLIEGGHHALSICRARAEIYTIRVYKLEISPMKKMKRSVNITFD